MSDAVIYVTYDGATEPLGRSQVVAYLERLASDFAVTLISFEKRSPTQREREHLEAAGIRWLPQTYHRRPSVLSTALDVGIGARAISRELTGHDRVVVHTRSYVPAEMAVRSLSSRNGRLLFDIRGFWIDERLEGGIWRLGLLARYARRRERCFYRRADAVVTLTEASLPVLRRWTAGRPVPITVIPTCADVARYRVTRPRPDGPRLVWVGSIGTWYRFDLAVSASRATGLRLRVLTGQRDAAAREARGDAEVGWVPHETLHEALHEGDVGLCLYKTGFSRLACAPTRFAEYLAAGMAVIVTPGVGDLERIVAADGVGVVLRREDEHGLRDAVAEALRLSGDQAVRDRCREVADHRFSVDAGANRYAELYRELLAEGATMFPS